MDCCPVTSNFNPAITVHDCIYLFCGDLLPPSSHFHCFLSVYIHGTDYVVKVNICFEVLHNFCLEVLHDLTLMLHDFDPCVQSFFSICY